MIRVSMCDRGHITLVSEFVDIHPSEQSCYCGFGAREIGMTNLPLLDSGGYEFTFQETERKLGKEQ